MRGKSLLVLGGARSGKSRYAQRRAEAAGGRLVFLATAEIRDDEMRDRIDRHRRDRGPEWTTIEEPLDLAQAIAAQAGPGATLLVDCLTLWAANLMAADRDVEAALADARAAMAASAGTIVLVANEVGLGIVPDNPLARRFRDVAGRINQAIAETADEVVFVAAGLPLTLK